MAVLRPHLALTVSDVERAIPFYAALFDMEPEKVKPGYAKFSVAEPAINFTLNEGERNEGLGAFNHAGIQVASTDDCYARQDKIWVHDPDGTPWEVFATHGDTQSEACDCGESGCACAAKGAESHCCA